MRSWLRSTQGPSRADLTHLREQVRAEPLLHERAVCLDHVGDEGVPAVGSLVPREDEAGVWSWRVGWAFDPAVSAAGGYGWDGVVCPPVTAACHGPRVGGGNLFRLLPDSPFYTRF